MKKTLSVALLLILASGATLLASGSPAQAPQLQPAFQAVPAQPIPALALPQLPAFLANQAATAAELPGGTGLICPILPQCDKYCTVHGCLVCCT